ncbi:MAG: AGE family epimerase/isomerase [Dokdonella sp.]
MLTTTLPDFRTVDFLRGHIEQTMAFYHPRCIDPAGGFFHYFKDDGTIYDRHHRHLVSSTRFVFNYAMAAREFGRDDYLDVARHGLDYLRNVHRDSASGAYAWTILDARPDDKTRHAYGMAFVLLAYSTALKAGIGEAAAWIDETWCLLEERFWDAQAGLYRDEADEHWQFSAYRGQNANMHLTEALLAAFEATNDTRYLDRTLAVADAMTRRQAAQSAGLVWEHYDAHWSIDWDYHRDDPKHLFRPWGFQPGHQTEWAKLLLTLDRYAPRDWLLSTATQLFDRAVRHAWDDEFGGLCYGFAPEGSICDSDKYFWVQAESIAAAALLHERTQSARHARDYDRLWAYSWAHLVDHEYGAWYRILDRENRLYSDEKSPAGKTDYHTMGACHEVIALLRRSPSALT